MYKRQGEIAAPRLVRGEVVFPDALLVPFTTGVDNVGEAVAAAAARTLERREVAVLVGEVLISISSIVAGLAGTAETILKKWG